MNGRTRCTSLERVGGTDETACIRRAVEAADFPNFCGDDFLLRYPFRL